MEKNFHQSVVYQIYPKSFKDSDEDGHGDLKGICQKMGYLATLGVDYIWLNPFYPSPQCDNGYDIADYYAVDKLYGTMADFELLVAEASRYDIGVMLDMVLNHSSTSHPWFKSALEGNKEKQDFYIFKEGVGGKEPNNWQSKFGGSAWHYVEQLNQYYLHLFDTSQADLNWENPDVRKEIYSIVKFWLDKGVKGLRFDVINLISKGCYDNDYEGDGRRFYTDGPQVHPYIHQLNHHSYGTYPDIITVGEMSSTTLEHCITYSKPSNQELSMVFNFHHLKVDYERGQKWVLKEFDFLELKQILFRWQEGMQQHNGWQALFWSNHDQPRVVSRFGNDQKYRVESAKMLSTTIHCMRGTPYIYQGEELGMSNAGFSDIGQYRDIESLNFYQILLKKGHTKEEALEILAERSRDNGRTPMAWSNEAYGGFSPTIPWIDLAKHWQQTTVEINLLDKESIFYHYQSLIRLRKENKLISEGIIKPLWVSHPAIFAYYRFYKGDMLLVVSNFYREPISLPPERLIISGNAILLLSNYQDSPTLRDLKELRAYESIIYTGKEVL